MECQTTTKPTRLLMALAIAASLGVTGTPAQAADVGSLFVTFISVLSGQIAAREEASMMQLRPALPGMPQRLPAPGQPSAPDLNLSQLESAPLTR